MEPSLAEVQESLAHRYRIEGRIGSGGMSTVYIAEDLKHLRKVAIKVLAPGLGQVIRQERFLREIATAATLTHPHILPLHDSGEAAGHIYYVMPFVQGESLRARLERERPLAVQEAVRITLEIAKALTYAHGEGVIHRDVKPENILLEAGQAVLSDFGVAQAISTTQTDDARLTVPGVAVGTPAYMSPEQASGEAPVDGRSDQYSLGCVLYEMLAGSPVFSSTSGKVLIHKHQVEKPLPITVHRPSVPREVERVLSRALEKLPSDRFSSVPDFADALEAASSFLPSGTRLGASVRRPLPRVSPRVLLPAMAFGVIVVAALGLRSCGPADPSWLSGGPESLVVIPFQTPFASSEEVRLAVDLSDQIAQELNRWDEVRALGNSQLTAIKHDLGVDTPVFPSIRAAARVARAAGVQAFLGVTAQIRGDSSFLEASLFDAETGRLTKRSYGAKALTRDHRALMDPLVQGLLGVELGGIDGENRGTRSLAAVRLLLAGDRELARAQLTEAESSYRQAMGRDSTYAPALSRLAMVLFWQAAEGSRRWPEVKDEVTRWSTMAMDGMASLSGADSLHVLAFYRLQLGDYAASRRLYGQLLESSPADLLAWLMVGAVEIHDPRMSEGSVMHPPPQSDLNAALEAFQRAMELQPTFELSYLQFSTIYEKLERALDLRACPLFHPPGRDFIPPWRAPEMRGEQAFCPVFTDSMEWIPKTAFDTLDPRDVLPGADVLLTRYLLILDRWASFAPSAPKPRELQARAIMARRGRERINAPQRLEVLAAQALERWAAALAVKPDTTPADLFLLANLHLAAGRRAEALELADGALAAAVHPDGSWFHEPPVLAANTFLATGRPLAALEIASGFRNTRLIRDPVSGGLLSYEGAEPMAMRVRILGAAGVTGEPLRQEVGAILERWSSVGYSPPQKCILQQDVGPRIGASLVQDSLLRATWEEYLSLEESLLGEVATTAPSGSLDTSRLEESLSAGMSGPAHAERVFTLAVEVGRLGNHRLSARLFARLDSIPHRVDGIDPGWGYQVLSWLYRAEVLRELGLEEEADAELGRFLAAWRHSDSLAQPLFHLGERRRSTGPGGRGP